MGILEAIAKAAEPNINRAAVGEFYKLARSLTLFRGDLLSAANHAKATRATTRVQDILTKAATAPGTTSSWADLLDYQVLSDAFSQSLRHVGVFDAALPSMIPSPLRSRAVKLTSLIVGSIVSEGAPKPITKLDLSSANDLVSPKKASAIVAVTKELLLLGDPSADQLFNKELSGAVVAATDKDFLTALIAINAPLTSGGAGAVIADISALLGAISTGPTSHVFVVHRPEAIKKIMMLTTDTGGRVFPRVGLAGGDIAPGLTLAASDQLAAGNAVAFSADGIAAAADTVVLDSSRNAILALDTAPTTPTAATVMTSLFQSDMVGLRAERYFGFSVVRPTAVASLTGIAY